MTAQAKPKKTGRPIGAKTADRDLVDVPPSFCSRCGSTERSVYNDVIRREGDGIIEGTGGPLDGTPYTAVELRPTKCLNPDCGQHRYDRTWEYIPHKTGSTN